MPLEPLTPQRRRQQTRDHLLQAAAQVFAERGFHGASLDEVAAVAGFSKGAVYSNFKNKDDLFMALLASRHDQDMEALYATLEASGDEPEAHLPDFVLLLRDQFKSSDDLWGALNQEFCVYALRNPEARAKLAAFDRADIDQVAEIIEVERKKHRLETTESAEHQARIVVALIRGLFSMRLIDESLVDEGLLESAMTFLARAILSAPKNLSA